MNILHATTDPTLLKRLKGMLVNLALAHIAVGLVETDGLNDLFALPKATKPQREWCGRQSLASGATSPTDSRSTHSLRQVHPLRRDQDFLALPPFACRVAKREGMDRRPSLV